MVERVAATTSSGCSPTTPSSSACPTTGRRRCAARSCAVDDGRRLSALVWGDGRPELVFLHGGAQNAAHVGHRRDGPRPAAGGHRPARARPLRRRQARASSTSPTTPPTWPSSIRALAPDAKAVVGMSLGGMTTLELARHAPELVRAIVLVDITPGVTAEKAKAITASSTGRRRSPASRSCWRATMEHNPTRIGGVAAARDPAQRRAARRTARGCGATPATARSDRAPTAASGRSPTAATLWDVVAGLTVPLLLVRGMRPQSVVDDADEAELLRRLPVGAGRARRGGRPQRAGRHPARAGPDHRRLRAVTVGHGSRNVARNCLRAWPTRGRHAVTLVACPRSRRPRPSGVTC